MSSKSRALMSRLLAPQGDSQMSDLVIRLLAAGDDYHRSVSGADAPGVRTVSGADAAPFTSFLTDVLRKPVIEVEPVLTPVISNDPLPVEEEVDPRRVKTGHMLLEGWAGSTAVATPVSLTPLYSSNDIEAIWIEVPTVQKVATGKKNHLKIKIEGLELRVQEKDGSADRVIWTIQGDLVPPEGGWEAAKFASFKAGQPFAYAAGPITVKMHWVRQNMKVGDLAPKRIVADRFGWASDPGPEFNISD